MTDPIAASAVVPEVDASSTSQHIDAGYGASLGGDAAAFSGSLERAADVAAPSAAAEVMMAPLDFIDNEAKSLVEYANSAIGTGNDMTPSEIVTLTVRSQQFMFHSQLTSNIANRTADGLQQLFRQQG